MTTETIAAGVVIAFVAATCQSVMGFGFALVMAPLLSVAWEVKPAVSVTILLGTVAVLPLLVEVRSEVPLGRVSVLLAGSVAGIPLGVFLLQRLGSDTLQIVVASAAIAAAVLVYLSPSLAWRGDGLPWRLTAGAMSGALGASTSLGGPPVVLYLLGCERRISVFRASLLAYFVPSSVLILIGIALVGRITGDVLLLAAAALPVIALGLAAGAWLRRHISPERFRPLVVGFLVLTSGAVLASAAGALS